MGRATINCEVFLDQTNHVYNHAASGETWNNRDQLSSTLVLTEFCLVVMSYYVSLMNCDSIHRNIQLTRTASCQLSAVSASLHLKLTARHQLYPPDLYFIELSTTINHNCRHHQLNSMINRQLERTILKNDQDGVLILNIFRNAGQGQLFYGTSRTRQCVAMTSSCNATSHWPFRAQVTPST